MYGIRTVSCLCLVLYLTVQQSQGMEIPQRVAKEMVQATQDMFSEHSRVKRASSPGLDKAIAQLSRVAKGDNSASKCFARLLCEVLSDTSSVGKEFYEKVLDAIYTNPDVKSGFQKYDGDLYQTYWKPIYSTARLGQKYQCARVFASCSDTDVDFFRYVYKIAFEKAYADSLQ